MPFQRKIGRRSSGFKDEENLIDLHRGFAALMLKFPSLIARRSL